MALNITQSVTDAWNAMYKRKCKFIVIRIDDNDAIVEAQGDSKSTFDDFKAAVPIDQPRWLVYDLAFTSKDGKINNKVIFAMYCPDKCTDGKAKFVYANKKADVRVKIDQINKEVQVNDHGDLKESEWIEIFE